METGMVIDTDLETVTKINITVMMDMEAGMGTLMTTMEDDIQVVDGTATDMAADTEIGTVAVDVTSNNVCLYIKVTICNIL